MHTRHESIIFQYNNYSSKQIKSYEIHQEEIKETLKNIITEIEEKGGLCFPSEKCVRIIYRSNSCI